MKIAIDISQIVHQGTGVSTYTRELVRHLLQLDEENTYILFGVSLRKRKILEAFYEELKAGHPNLFSAFFSMPPSLASFLWNDLHIISLNRMLGDIDIFHSSDWIQPPVHAMKVTTIHDLVVYRYPDTSHKNIISTHKKRLAHVAKECDVVIADSEATKRDIESILKIDTEKIHVIYLGIDAKFQYVSAEEIDRVQKKYHLPPKFLLSVGTNEPRKNLVSLIRAKELLHSDIPLYLVGNAGWGDSSLRGRDVYSLGFIPDEDIAAVYSSATLFVYPSIYEGFGLPVLEAMACGTPVITTDKGSLKEIAGNVALLADPQNPQDIADCIQKLLDDNAFRIQRSQRGISYTKSFTWEKTARMTLEVYRSLIQ